MPAPAAPTTPLTAARCGLLRVEVGRLRQRETRRVFDTSVHVGCLGAERTGFVVRAQDLPVVDAAMRVDLLSALLETTPSVWLTTWLVRAGTPEPHDMDLAWLAAARTAFGMHDRPLDGCFALTRYGWRDVVGGESRTWVRLRL